MNFLISLLVDIPFGAFMVYLGWEAHKTKVRSDELRRWAVNQEAIRAARRDRDEALKP